MGSARRSFTDEYKRDPVMLVTEGGYFVKEVATKFEISETTIRKWMKTLQTPAGGANERPLTESEQIEMGRLRKDNAKLEMELDFAKEVSTRFAKGQQ